MRGKKLLAAFLLSVGLCFVPAVGHGVIKHELHENSPTYMDFYLLNAKLMYMMYNPTNFLNIFLDYDLWGTRGEILFPKRADVNTQAKICIMVIDNRGVFSGKSGTALLEQFKQSLEVIYSFIKPIATDMNDDIVAAFLSEDKEGAELGYFYQGEYYLWEK